MLAFQELAPWQIRAAAQHRFSIWVVLADVDSMGKINDRYGREAGNTVLRVFAKIITDNSRSADICARAGDDKFALLVTHQSNKSIAEIVIIYLTQKESPAMLSSCFSSYQRPPS